VHKRAAVQLLIYKPLTFLNPMFVDHWLVFDACMKSGMCVTPINEHQVKNASLLLKCKKVKYAFTASTSSDLL
jgi:hypothetical protein